MSVSAELIIPEIFAEPVEAAAWMQKHLSFSDEYFTELIGISEELFQQWKRGRKTIKSSQVRKVEDLFFAINRLLSFFNFRRDLMMRVLDIEFDSVSYEVRGTSVTPPWLGNSLRGYMLRHGSRGIHDVACWVQKTRSANSP